MVKKMKDQKLSSACNQESPTNEPQNNQDKAQPDVTLGPSTKISSPSHDNAPNSNQQQQPPIVQRSYTSQNATEQLIALSIPTQGKSPPGFLNQWQQLPHPQQGQVFAQSTSPFWHPQWLAGGSPFLGANVPPIFQTFTPAGVTDSGWQAHHTPVPNMCYPVGYTFPGFPGPWDPSSWLGQIHQLQHPYVYNFPGALGFSSATPTMSGCSTSGEHSFKRGNIRPTLKLSQKHQQLWEAQSMENVQLRSMVNKLQAEVSDYKDRLGKLEEEVSLLKQKGETPKTEAAGTIPIGTGQPPKRGRPPKRSLASVNALHKPHPGAQGRKPALNQTQFESESPIFEKDVLKKVENKEISNHSTSKAQGKKPALNRTQFESKSNIFEKVILKKVENAVSNSMMSAYPGQVHQEYQGIQMCGIGTPFSYAPGPGVKVNFEKDKGEDMKIVYFEQSQPNEVLNSSMGVSAKYIGNTGNEKFGCTSSNDSARDVLDAARQSFFHNDSLIQQGEKITRRWNFANEDDASEELEVDIVGSSKDENEEEMGDEISFPAETKDVGGCTMP